MTSKKYAPLGKVLHIVDKEAIVKLTSKKIPKKDLPVLNENLEKIGKTTNPFGPVKSPYVGVILDNKNISLKPGSMLLLEIKKKPSTKKNKQRKKISKNKYKKNP